MINGKSVYLYTHGKTALRHTSNTTISSPTQTPELSIHISPHVTYMLLATQLLWAVLECWQHRDMNLDLIKSRSWGSERWSQYQFRRVGRETVPKEVKRRGRGRVWWQGGLPVALAPTGSNLEQTAPNVFIRLWLGWAQVGRACPAWRWIVLIVPSIKRHLFQWGNEGEREREREARGRRRELPVKSHVLWCLDNFVY